tara:strand:+ start:352 stop:462 length:111 start_codon:yes stop_codon:yes gene_type:complete
MMIYGRTPMHWIKQGLNNKKIIASYIVVFILGAIIF